MKKITLFAFLVVAIAASATAQSSVGVSWVKYANTNNQDPGPLRVGEPKGIVFYLNNTGDHPVMLKYYNITTSIGGKETSNTRPWPGRLAPLTEGNKLDFYVYVPIVDKGTVADSIAMQKGTATLKLTVHYHDDYANEDRVYSVSMTLKDHHSPQTLTDNVILREDKKEGN